MSKGARYQFLDHCRGVACLLVVIFHSIFYLRGSSSPVIQVLARFWIGVPIFFVISGYCISATADSTRRRNGTIKNYFARRVRRIFPPYWICLVLTVALAISVEAARPGMLTDTRDPIPAPSKFTTAQWLGNLSLTEMWRPHLLGRGDDGIFELAPAWTLGYEEQFYLCVGLILLLSSRRFFAGAIVVTLIACIADVVSRKVGFVADGLFFTRVGWLQFACGILVYWAVNYAHRRGFILAGLALILMAGFFGRNPHHLLSNIPDNRHYGFVAAAFGLLILLTHRFDARLAGSLALRPLKICGEMCYSLYLIHWPICKLISHLFWLHGVRSVADTVLATVPACVFVSAAAGWCFFYLVESRFLNSKPPELKKFVDLPLSAVA